MSPIIVSISVAVFGLLYSFLITITAKLGRDQHQAAAAFADRTHRISIGLLFFALPLFAAHYIAIGFYWTSLLMVAFAVVMSTHVVMMPAAEKKPLKKTPRDTALSEDSATRLNGASVALFLGSCMLPVFTRI